MICKALLVLTPEVRKFPNSPGHSIRCTHQAFLSILYLQHCCDSLKDEKSILRETSETPSSQLQTGNQAQLTHGPFSGFIATIVSVEPNSRINALIDIMGQTAKVVVDAGALQRIS